MMMMIIGDCLIISWISYMELHHYR